MGCECEPAPRRRRSHLEERGRCDLVDHEEPCPRPPRQGGAAPALRVRPSLRLCTHRARGGLTQALAGACRQCVTRFVVAAEDERRSGLGYCGAGVGALACRVRLSSTSTLHLWGHLVE